MGKTDRLYKPESPLWKTYNPKPRLIDVSRIVNIEVKTSDGNDYVLLPVKHLSDIPVVNEEKRLLDVDKAIEYIEKELIWTQPNKAWITTALNILYEFQEKGRSAKMDGDDENVGKEM